MALLLEKEKEVIVQKTGAEVLEAHARAAKERAGKKKLLAEAENQRADTERKEIENDMMQIELERAKIQLAIDLVTKIKPDLPEDEKFSYVMNILLSLNTIIISPLHISPTAPE